MKRLLICADHPMFGAAANLAEAINLNSKKYDADVIYRIKAPYGSAKESKHVIHWTHANPDDYDTLFIVDYHGLIPLCSWFNRRTKSGLSFEKPNRQFTDWAKRKEVYFWWTGSGFRRNHLKVLDIANLMGCKKTFAMPDLMRLDENATVLLQTFNIVPLSHRFEKFTVVHLAGNKHKLNGKYQKGSDVIAKCIKEAQERLSFDFITKGVIDYREALILKSKAHIFIDQFAQKVGGIGKAGLEALCLGTPVICDIKHAYDYLSEGHYGGCPVFDKDGKLPWIVGNNIHYLMDCWQHEHEAALKWAEKLSYKNTVNYLEKHL